MIELDSYDVWSHPVALPQCCHVRVQQSVDTITSTSSRKCPYSIIVKAGPRCTTFAFEVWRKKVAPDPRFRQARWRENRLGIYCLSLFRHCYRAIACCWMFNWKRWNVCTNIQHRVTTDTRSVDNDRRRPRLLAVANFARQGFRSANCKFDSRSCA